MNTILFDLDGTLLPINTDEFTKNYFTHLSMKLKDYIPPKELPELIWASTKYMISNLEENKTNKEAFFEDFEKRIKGKVNDLIPIIDEFYKKDFSRLKGEIENIELIKNIIKVLKEKNYDLVIATNPLFPKDAIYHRVDWTGLDHNDFKLITTYEKMHFCKPNLEYYKEILSIIDRKSDEVMMVGNDVQEDMIVSELGIKNYLIEDYLIDRNRPSYHIDNRGSIEDFYQFSLALPNAQY